MPDWTIHVRIESRYAGQVRPALLRAAARAALRHQAVAPGAELTLVVTGDAALRRLNKQFMGHDEPTDVLSFPFEDPASHSRRAKPKAPPAAPRRYLGDIAISLPRAKAQARRAGQSLAAELRLLAVHGVLHLLGHDHARPRQHARMWAAQTEILKGLNP